MKSEATYSRGATLVELIVIMAIVGIMARLVTLNLFSSQQRASITTARDGIIRDIRAQQLRAMSGDTASPGIYTDYSIRFETNRYILFPGSVYVNGNSANTVVPLDTILHFSSIVVPNSQITFARLSGANRGYIAGQDSITLVNIQTGGQYVIRFNAYGIPSVQ